MAIYLFTIAVSTNNKLSLGKRDGCVAGRRDQSVELFILYTVYTPYYGGTTELGGNAVHTQYSTQATVRLGNAVPRVVSINIICQGCVHPVSAFKTSKRIALR